MGYDARILADSLNSYGDRLTTMELQFPRMVLAEFNTHRMFSRNSASSRAIPVEKQIKKVLEDPFLPVHWGKNQPGMSAELELIDEARLKAQDIWLYARDRAVASVQSLLTLGLHKQVANRLLEPFMWHTAIISGTDDAWANFFHLRRSKFAQPEIRVAADFAWDHYKRSEPKVLATAWHLPLVSPELDNHLSPDDLRLVSVGRCARVSYLTHDGVRDPMEDVKLAKRLSENGHWSPFEHVAQPAYLPDKVKGNFKGFHQFRHFFDNEYITKYEGEPA